MDISGPSSPADRDGYRYVLTYLCKFSKAALLEPLRDLSHSEVPRAFSKCVLRSGALAKERAAPRLCLKVCLKCLCTHDDEKTVETTTRSPGTERVLYVLIDAVSPPKGLGQAG